MEESKNVKPAQYRLEREQLQRMFDVLAGKGYRILGPTVRDGAIVYDELTTSSDLPTGWTDEQDGGTYRSMHSSASARANCTPSEFKTEYFWKAGTLIPPTRPGATDAS